MKRKIWYTYDDIHRVIKGLAEKIQNSGTKYDAMIAIGGGGFIPARMLRCFLEIPIYAVTTAYYDSDNEGQVTEEVKKVQWLDPVPDALKGKNVLVVDEVDDSRVTMEFCLNELLKEDFGTVGVAVLHEKSKPKSVKFLKVSLISAALPLKTGGSTILGTRWTSTNTTNWPRKTNKSGTTIATSLFI